MKVKLRTCVKQLLSSWVIEVDYVLMKREVNTFAWFCFGASIITQKLNS